MGEIHAREDRGYGPKAVLGVTSSWGGGKIGKGGRGLSTPPPKKDKTQRNKKPKSQGLQTVGTAPVQARAPRSFPNGACGLQVKGWAASGEADVWVRSVVSVLRATDTPCVWQSRHCRYYPVSCAIPRAGDTSNSTERPRELR